MRNKIGLEEHYVMSRSDVAPMGAAGATEEWIDRIYECGSDFGSKRLEAMDEAGIERMVLSLAPSCQGAPEGEVVGIARRYNDYLAEKVSANPSRFSGFAALPMHHPEAAIEELTRCVNKLGFVGALVDGYSRMDDGRAIYYDTPEYAPFWQTVEELNVPFYLHPAMPSETCAYKGREFMLGPVFGFAVETLLHSYRLIGSGLFDRHPNLNIVLGHLAEAYAFTVWRSDRWLQDFSKGYEAEKEISYYFRHNFFATVAGNFSTQSFMITLNLLGADRLLFSTDYPYEDAVAAAQWFDALDINSADLQNIGRENARKLMKL